MGPVGAVAGRAVRPRLRHPEGARPHHLLVSAHRRERGRGGRQLGRAGLQPDPHRDGAGRHPRLRRAHGRAPVEVPRDPQARGARPRDVGERRLVVDGRRVLVGADVRGPGAGPGLHPHEPADDRLLRRLPARRQPLRHERHRARRADRGARLALPDRAPRHLELRQSHRADRPRRDRRRTPDADRRPGHEAGLRLHLRPRDR